MDAMGGVARSLPLAVGRYLDSAGSDQEVLRRYGARDRAQQDNGRGGQKIMIPKGVFSSALCVGRFTIPKIAGY